MHNHMILLDVRRHVLAGQESTVGQHRSVSVAHMHRQQTTDRPLDSSQVSGSKHREFTASRMCSVPVGELPPPAPRACFGREELIDEVVGIAESLEPIALIGAGGMGKTSIALTVLHDDRIKERFGSNRRFVRCDKFPASLLHFLARLSKVVGAGVENPEDMAPLRPLLSTKKMMIVLDNAESILDPQGTDYREIYAVVDELCQFKTICVCITSRITTVPRYCKRPPVPTLSMEAACNIFYGIYGGDTRSGIINDLLHHLDFHALSITLLATTALDNMWDHDRLAKEWNLRRAQVLQTDRSESLAATIELSLASPTFSKLGPNARDLLGVVAFFPQGVDEENLDWLFPTIPDNRTIFDKFCALSLTYRSNGFVTMLAPIKDHLCPQDPKASPFLCAAKDHYLTRLSVDLDPDMPGFGEAQWIKSEDTNVEHLLNVFASIDVDAFDVLDACVHFMQHLYWQKPRQIVLKSKIEGLPDDHPSKAECLFELSQLCGSVGNRSEQKRLLIHTLKLERERGDDFLVAETLEFLSQVNRHIYLPREGIHQAEEALEIFRRLGNTKKQADCLDALARSLLDDNQLDAAEDATLRNIELLPEQGEEFRLCKFHRLLGNIYNSKGEKEKAIHNFETALAIASPFIWQDQLFWIHYSMAELFHNEDEFDDANTHLAQTKSYTADDPYSLGRAMEMQARIWYSQCGPEDARSEVLGALEIYERLGAGVDVGRCRELLREIEEAMEGQDSGELDYSGEFPSDNVSSHPC